MIVDDHHALIAVLAADFGEASRTPPIYLDARVPTTMHLRLVSGLFKPGTGRLTRLLQAAQPDPELRQSVIDRIAAPRRGLTVLDDRPLAAAIGALTAEPGVSIAFAALIAHAQAAAQPILIVPDNRARWVEAAEAHGVQVVAHPIDI